METAIKASELFPSTSHVVMTRNQPYHINQVSTFVLEYTGTIYLDADR